MKLGLIARADNGGLGAQTWEAWRHLRPERTLLIDMAEHGRGECQPDRFRGDFGLVYIVRGYPEDRHVEKFVDGLDAVFTCETFYSPRFVRLAKRHGVRCVAQCNPELYDAHHLAGAHVVLPTSWEAERVPGAEVLPVPIGLDRFAGERRQRTEARVFYHPTAPAMLDRNGSLLVRQALPFVKSQVTVIIRGAEGLHGFASSRQITDTVQLVELPNTPEPYWAAYPPDADVLLLPRRYGGLCLPMQETAALGLPTITTALAPQVDYPHAWYVPAERPSPVDMKGGRFDVWNADPRLLAAMIDELAARPDLVADLSEAALEWSAALAWEHHQDAYGEVLAGA